MLRINSASYIAPCIVINGTHPTLRSDPYSPGAVLRALHALGWVIPPDEHDAHELLHVLLASLEEEAIRPKKIGCLSDALGDMMLTATPQHMPQARPSSALLSDFCNAEYDESTGMQMRQVRSEAHTPDSPHSTCTDSGAGGDTNHSNGGGGDDQNHHHHHHTSPFMMDQSIESPMIFSETRRSRARRPTLPNHLNNGANGGAANGSVINKRNSMSCRSLERLSRGPGRVSVWSEQAQIQVPHPFRGAQSSQMICSGCGHKVEIHLLTDFFF